MTNGLAPLDELVRAGKRSGAWRCDCAHSIQPALSASSSPGSRAPHVPLPALLIRDILDVPLDQPDLFGRQGVPSALLCIHRALRRPGARSYPR